MILIANILRALAVIVEMANGLLTIYKYVLIAAALISWVNPDPYNPIVSFLHRVTEPVLSRIRRYMPDTGAVDLSPLVAFALIYLVQIVLLDTAYQYLFNASLNLRLR
jgi:YggT family protein